MNCSESIENITKAFVAFQQAVQNPKNTATNPFHKNTYCPLEEVLNTVRPVLSEHGLAVMQDVGIDAEAGAVRITTRIIHESGEWMESAPMVMPVEEKRGTTAPQSAGTSITYGRRYQLSAFLGISSEDDSDGGTVHKRQAPQKKSAPPQENGKVSKAQLQKIYAMAQDAEVEKDEVKETMEDITKREGVSSKDLTKDEASKVIEWLQVKLDVKNADEEAE